MARTRVSLANGTSRGLVLDLIRARGPISRVDLADATGLTQATMSTVVRQLMEDGLVVATGRGESTGGKPPVLLDIEPKSRFAVGVQLGSEANTYVVVDLIGAIAGRARTTGIGSNRPEEQVGAIAEEIDGMLAALGIDKERVVGVGVVAPGPLDLRRGVILGPSHRTTWKNVSIRAMLAGEVGRPVILDNDATAAAIGDFWGGGLGDAVSHATVYMGSGIGSGILLDGSIFRGASSNTGELGQLVIGGTLDAPLILEDVASPAAIVAAGASQPGLAERLGLEGRDEFDDFKTIAMAAVRGDESAVELLRHAAEHLATAVVGMANLFDLDSISLAGPAFSIAGPIFVQTVTARLEQEFFAGAQHGIKVLLSAHVADAAAVGAAALVLQTLLAPRTMGPGPVIA